MERSSLSRNLPILNHLSRTTMNLKQLTKFYQELPVEQKDQFHDLVADDMVGRMQTSVGVEDVPIIKPLMDFYDEAKRTMRVKGILSGLSSGLPTLDFINGGFDKQELIIVTGETGIGKTNLAMNALFHIAQRDVPVLFFTMEMSTVEVVQRFIGFDNESGSVAAKPIHFYADPRGVDIHTLRASIRYSVKELGVEIVVIDHLHYFAKKAENNREELEIICREIKTMAREYDVPIILIAHTRRLPGNQTRPYLSDIKDTSSIAQDADQVIIVWKDTRSSDPEERWTLHFEVAKNRLKGKCEDARFKISKNYLLVDDNLYTNAQEIYGH